MIQQAGGKYCTIGRPLTIIQRRPKVAGPMWNHYTESVVDEGLFQPNNRVGPPRYRGNRELAALRRHPQTQLGHVLSRLFDN
jgi:hypothetical protein